MTLIRPTCPLCCTLLSPRADQTRESWSPLRTLRARLLSPLDPYSSLRVRKLLLTYLDQLDTILEQARWQRGVGREPVFECGARAVARIPSRFNQEEGEAARRCVRDVDGFFLGPRGVSLSLALFFLSLARGSMTD